MKKNNYFILLLLTAFLLTSCSSVQEGIGAKKKRAADEFLVKKKNPLTLPPEYYELPVPSETKKNEKEIIESDSDIKELIGKTSQKNIKKSNQSSSVEKSIIKKIQSK